MSRSWDSTARIGRYIDDGVLMSQFNSFWTAVWNANVDGRVNRVRRITNRDGYLPGFDNADPGRLTVRVLGPVPTSQSGAVRYVTFQDPHDLLHDTGGAAPGPSSSHTRNGHSVVLRLEFGRHSFLMGGDLNIPAERHLIARYAAGPNPFRVTVAKACHHGSSDFTTDWLRLVRPYATVFSSGDNKSFDHPMPDSLGAASRHTRGNIPLLFSTELGRAHSSRGIHYGLVNARSNGRTLVMAQMKEQRNRPDVWDSFTVPYRGRFPGV